MRANPIEQRVGLTGDGFAPDGTWLHGNLGLERLTAAGLEPVILPRPQEPTYLDEVGTVGSVISFSHAPFRETELRACPDLRHIARFGAGHESIDLDACTAYGVVATNTPEAIRRPLALAGLTLLLALSHNLLNKHRITVEGRWRERGGFRGRGVRDQTLGILGFGNVGAELAELAQPLGLNVIGTNRSGRNAEADRLGVPLVSPGELAERSDFLVLTAALTADSRHMVDAKFLSRMKPTSFLINIGRGGLVDQAALRNALQDETIAGAALDVFDPEPVDPGDPLLGMKNVVLTPHSLCWTADFAEDVTKSVFEAVIDVAQGRRPKHLLNPEAWERDETEVHS
ncbi:NAD(P)-dependent oxidoreductase [Nesterenkonia sphaerica]|uniref:Glyoxylate reductase n=1 Tax=Nesterenkonia sphaerica TaxID=1804988 RepID=A0A5R9AKC5_9MICC|nr:NAD(P)-dependent oxidoreductase [Nesterenkonia sphaerica]TLP79023.1 glyoxylate reductase [Nesterenkonia sphaerica]